MEKEIRNRSRRKFMVASSAAIVSPMLLNLALPATEARAATTGKKAGKIYFITTGCNGCHVCKVACPQKAISYGDRKMEIDQDKCVQCGTCCEECPNSAISETEL